MTATSFHSVLSEVLRVSTPVLSVHGVTNRRWKRIVKEGDSRRGPWLSGLYNVLNQTAWDRTKACVYLVTCNGVVHYVGKSTASFKTRWKLCPAQDMDTGSKLQQRELFHSQCWAPITQALEAESCEGFLVHVLPERQLEQLLQKNGWEEDILAVPHSSLVDKTEAWLLQAADATTFAWNKQYPGFVSKRARAPKSNG